MMSESCSAIPRSTLLTFALGKTDLSHRLTAEVVAHVRHCGHCRHLVRRLHSSGQALRTLGFSATIAEALTGSFSGPVTTLRGRILGAARDRAWSELNRRLRGLRTRCRQLGLDPLRPGWMTSPETDTEAETEADRGWEQQRAAVGALVRRLEGLGIHVDLSDLPIRRPSPPALPWVIRHLDDLLRIVGGPGAGHALAEDYQPSAAPSFLDSLPPL